MPVFIAGMMTGSMTDDGAIGIGFRVSSLITDVKKGGWVVRNVSRGLSCIISIHDTQCHRTGALVESFYYMDREVKLICMGAIKNV